MIRLVLIAHSRLHREALAHCLSGYPQLLLAAAAGEAHELASLVTRHRPQVVLADALLPGILEQVDAVTAASPAVRVLVLSVTEDRASTIACARAGAIGFVSKDAPVAELVAAVEAAARGDFAGSPRVCGWLMAELRRVGAHAPTGASPEVLTARESETLQLLAQGLSNRQIAGRLGIGISTVKHHVHHILDKLDVRRRAEAVARLRHYERLRLAAAPCVTADARPGGMTP